MGRRPALRCTRRDTLHAARLKGRDAAVSRARRDAPEKWREAAVGRRSAELHQARAPPHAARRPRAATQQRAAQGAMLRSGVARGGCGPPVSFELHQAPRSARRETAKGRNAAASGAMRNARVNPSCARRPRGRRAARGCKGRAARSERRGVQGTPSRSKLQRARGSK